MAIRHLSQGREDGDVVGRLGRTPSPEVAEAIAAIGGLRAAFPDGGEAGARAVRREVLDALFETRVPALTVPLAYGGLGGTTSDFCRAVAALGEVDAALVVTAVPHLCNGVKSIALFGDERQRREILGGLCAERRLVAFAITEAHTGSDVASHRSKLQAAGEGRCRLDGAKTWITNVPFARDVVVVAKCPGLSAVPDGSAFVVVRRDDPGFVVSREWDKLGVNGSPTVDLFLDGVIVPADRIVGRPGAGMAHFAEVVGPGRLGAAAGACGLARAALRVVEGLPCAEAPSPRARAAFGRRLFVMEATVAATAALSDDAVADRDEAIALCKAFCTREADALAREAYAHAAARCEEVPAALARIVADAPILRVLEGPNEVLSLRAALALVTASRAPLGSTRAPPRGEREDAWREALERFAALVRVAAETPRLGTRTVLLARVADAAATLHAAACARAHRAHLELAGPADGATRELAASACAEAVERALACCDPADGRWN
jgi:alkylation response protein AidB-like acyl-CoA dehydrogenase